MEEIVSLELLLGVLAPDRWDQVRVCPKDWESDHALLLRVREWASGWEKRRRPLVISGPCGCGKKTLAYMACKEMGWRTRVYAQWELNVDKAGDKGLFDDRRVCVVVSLEKTGAVKGVGVEKGEDKESVSKKLSAMDKRYPTIYLSAKHWSKKHSDLFGAKGRSVHVKLRGLEAKELRDIAFRAAYLFRDSNDRLFIESCIASCGGNASKLVYDLSMYREGFEEGVSALIKEGRKRSREAEDERALAGVRKESFLEEGTETRMKKQKVYAGSLQTEVDDGSGAIEFGTRGSGYGVSLCEKQDLFVCTSRILSASGVEDMKKREGLGPEWLVCREGEDSSSQFELLYENYPSRCAQHAPSRVRGRDGVTRTRNTRELEALARTAELFSDVDMFSYSEETLETIDANAIAGALVCRVGLGIELASHIKTPVPRLSFGRPVTGLVRSVRDSERTVNECHASLLLCNTGIGEAGAFVPCPTRTALNLDVLPFFQTIVYGRVRDSEVKGDAPLEISTPGAEDKKGYRAKAAEMVCKATKSTKKGSLEAHPFARCKPFVDFVLLPKHLVPRSWKNLLQCSAVALRTKGSARTEAWRKTIAEAWAYNFDRTPLSVQKALKPRVTKRSVVVDTALAILRRARFDTESGGHRIRTRVVTVPEDEPCQEIVLTRRRGPVTAGVEKALVFRGQEKRAGGIEVQKFELEI